MTTAPAGDGVYEFPATAVQLAMWFAYQSRPDSVAYNVPLAARVAGALDERALRDAFAALVDRHEILRTVFRQGPESLVQVVRDRMALDMTVDDAMPAEAAGVDAGDGAAEAAAERAQRRAEALARAPFDLETGPLLRVRVEGLGPHDRLLVVVFHHIVIDHLSLGQFVDELKVLYRSRAGGGSDGLAAPALQFADYAVWATEHGEAPDLAAKLAAWKARLEGFSGVLELPAETSAPSAQASGEQRFALDPALTARVRAFARAQGVSLFVVTLSALQCLLHRLSGQRDIVVGTPFANRAGMEALDSVLGCFINTLPIPTDFSGLPDFAQVVRSVNAALAAAFASQEVPFERIVRAIAPPRVVDRNPIFQVGFVLQSPPVRIALPGLAVTEIPVHTGDAMYDLHFWLWEAEERLAGLVWYDRQRFSAESIDLLVRRYQTLLAAAVEAPSAPLGNLPVLLPEERMRLAAFNRTDAARPGDSDFVSRFEDGAARWPDAIALTCGEAEIRYAELNRRANQLARRLRDSGIAGGRLVALCLSRRVELVVALLAVQKAGAAYLPMDPRFPADRLGYMLENSGADLVIVGRDAPPLLPPGATCVVLDLDAEHQGIAALDGRPVDRLPDPDATAYLIYTSGSTGRPKGVRVPHRALLNLLASMQARPGFGPSDVLAAVTTISFDIAALEIFGPLLVGARVHLVAPDVANDGVALARELARCGATMMQATPMTWRLLLETPWRASGRFVALCGGEALPAPLADALLDRGPELWNLYGPTETTVWSTAGRIERDRRRIGIGRPIDNTRVHVVDKAGGLAPPGYAGEICIAGEGLALGYHALPELTAERFVPEIDAPSPGARMYRTGDLGRWAMDGQLEHLGRIDDQIKVRGFRIEPGEIETVAASLPSIAEIAVCRIEQSDEDARLVAYVRLRDGHELTSTELRAHLGRYLPDYMIPQLLVPIDRMPRTPNGKLDRKALPDPFAHAAPARAHVAPRTAGEAYLVGVACRLLGVDSISVDANFFEHGGSSLLAMRAVAELERDLGLRLNPRDFILNTLAQIAARFPEPRGEAADTADGSPSAVGPLRRLFHRWRN